jgi:ribonuclease VapC
MVVDTSALMAVLNDEVEAARCKNCLEAEPELVLSAGTLAEAMVVSTIRGLGSKMAELVANLRFEIVPVTAAAAHRIGRIYEKWGKGMHPAGLNFGDCFAYELAQSRGCKLLFVGNDFSRTDIQSAL